MLKTLRKWEHGPKKRAEIHKNGSCGVGKKGLYDRGRAVTFRVCLRHTHRWFR